MSFDRIHTAKAAVSDPSKMKNSIRLDLDERRRQNWTFFCPLCAVSRSLNGSPRPGRPIHFIQVGLCALVFTLATYSWLEWKGLVSFIPMWMIFEMTYRARIRARVRCQECGFDPLLCLSDVDRAKREVENHWKKKFEERGIPYPTPERQVQLDRESS